MADTDMGGMCYCEADFDSYAISYERKTPVARKRHRCVECGGWIERGEKYERVKAMWSGPEFDSIATHLACAGIRRDFCCNQHYALSEGIFEDAYGFSPWEVPRDG